MKKLNKYLFLIVVFLASSFVSAHELDYSSEDVRKIYERIFKEFERETKVNSSTKYIELISRDGRSFKVPEGKFSNIVRESLLLNIDIITRNCSANKSCDVKTVKTYANKNLKSLLLQAMKKIKDGAHHIQDFIMDLLWDSVTGTRRYGVLYISLVATGEVIEHAIIHPLGIPIPLCKFVQAGTVKILDSTKQAILRLFSRFPIRFTFRDRLKSLFADISYKRSFHRHINRFLVYSSDPSRMNQSFFNKVKGFFKKESYFDKSVRTYYLHNFKNVNSKKLSSASIPKNFKLTKPYLKMFQVVRDIEALNFLIGTNELVLKALHEEGHLSVRQYVKAKWDLGAIGNYVDSYKAQALALKNANEYVRFQKSLDNVLSDIVMALKKFSNDPISFDSKKSLKLLKLKVRDFKSNLCQKYFLLHVLK